MAGIFSPQLNTQGGGGRVVEPTQSPGLVGLGGAIQGLTSLTDALGSMGQEPEMSATDEKNAALRPFVRDLKRLNQTRRGGKGNLRFNTELKKLTVDAIGANPAFEDDIVGIVKSVTGRDIGQALTPGEAIDSGFIDFLNTAEGQMAAWEYTVFNEDGSTNDQATALGMQEAYHNHQSRQVRAARIKQKAEVSGDLLTLAENEAKTHLPVFYAEQGMRVKRIFDNMLKSTLVQMGNPDNPVDANRLRSEARALIPQIKAELNQQAAAEGYEGLTEYDVDIPMQYATDMINMMDKSFEDFIELAQTLDVRDRMLLGEAFNNTSHLGVGGHSQELQRAMGEQLNMVEIDTLNQMSTWLKENADLRGTDSVFNMQIMPSDLVTEGEDGQEEEVSTEFVRPFSEEQELAVTERTSEERQTLARNGFNKFKTFKGMDNPDVVRTVVEGLGEALLAVQVEALPMSDSTFSQVFNEQFFSQYEQISEDEELKGHMDNALGSFFADEIDTRVTNLQRELQENKGFRTIRMDLNENGEISLHIGPGFANSPAPGDKRIRTMMEQMGLPLNDEGLEQLMRSTRERASEAQRRMGIRGERPLGEHVDPLGGPNIRNQFRSLNKVLLTARRFTEIGKVIDNRMRGNFDAREVVVTTEKEFNDLPDGTPYVTFRDDGTEIHDVK